MSATSRDGARIAIVSPNLVAATGGSRLGWRLGLRTRPVGFKIHEKPACLVWDASCIGKHFVGKMEMEREKRKMKVHVHKS